MHVYALAQTQVGFDEASDIPIISLPGLCGQGRLNYIKDQNNLVSVYRGLLSLYTLPENDGVLALFHIHHQLHGPGSWHQPSYAPKSQDVQEVHQVPSR